MINVSEILAAIDKGADIPTLASVMRNLLKINGEDEQTHDRFLDLVRNDIGLTVRLLRTANRTEFENSPVNSVEDAVARLGFQNARNLALTVPFIDDRHDNDSNSDHQRLQWLWERAICTATASEAFAARLKVEHLSKVRTTGLLLDLGIFFLATNFPGYYSAIIDQWQSEGGNLLDIENDALGVNHSVIGGQLARKWNLGGDLERVLQAQEVLDLSAEAAVDMPYYHLANLTSALLFEDRHVMGFERAIRFAIANFNIDRPHLIDEIQRITLIADQASMKISLQKEPALSYVDLLKGVNFELGKATLSFEEMIRALEIAMRKAEQLAQKLEDANHKLRDAANHDPLTHIHNRRFFEEFLNWNFNRAQRYQTTLGCLMLDIDHFKQINDTYGHLTGDKVLQEVAEALKSNLRNTDVVARYGGEEFVVLLPETKDHAVYLTATKLNKAVKKIKFQIPEGEFGVTISVGFVSYSPQTLPDVVAPMEVVRAADVNMYSAKKAGRDRVWPEFVSNKSSGT